MERQLTRQSWTHTVIEALPAGARLRPLLMHVVSYADNDGKVSISETGMRDLGKSLGVLRGQLDSLFDEAQKKKWLAPLIWQSGKRAYATHLEVPKEDHDALAG